MICIPIKEKTLAKVLLQMELAAREADLMEIWLDQITDLHLFKIIKHKTCPLIFVNKPVREQGGFTGSEENRVDLLIQAIDLGADYVDIGIDTNEELITKLISANRNRAKIIISYHNFLSTPKEKELKLIINQAYKLGANIVKVATKANQYADNLKIFKLITDYKKQKKDLIALCMGDYGKLSRIAAPLLGSYLTYAPLEENSKTAPGQIPVSQLRSILEIIK